MATARDWITRALRKNGALGFAEPLAAEDASIALDELRAMLDAWNIERAWVFSSYRDSLPLTGGTEIYSTALLAQGRPVSVLGAMVSSGGVSRDVNLLVSADEYARIRAPVAVAGVPRWCWYNEAMPNGEFRLWPVPGESGTLDLVCTGAALAVGALGLDTPFVVPAGYEKAVVDSLAVETASAFGVEPSDTLRMGAIEAKAWVKRHNRKPRDVRWTGLEGLFVGRTYDIREG